MPYLSVGGIEILRLHMHLWNGMLRQATQHRQTVSRHRIKPNFIVGVLSGSRMKASVSLIETRVKRCRILRPLFHISCDFFRRALRSASLLNTWYVMIRLRYRPTTYYKYTTSFLRFCVKILVVVVGRTQLVRARIAGTAGTRELEAPNTTGPPSNTTVTVNIWDPVFNELPADIRKINTFLTVKRHLKTFLFKAAYTVQ